MPTQPNLEPLSRGLDPTDTRPIGESFPDALDRYRQNLVEAGHAVGMFELLESLRWLRKTLGIVERQADGDAANMARDSDSLITDENGDAVAHLAAKPKRYRHDSHSLFRAMSRRLVDPETGLSHDAVPLDVLVELVPESARFNSTAIGTLVADQHREALAPEFTVKPGPKGGRR